MKILVFSDSHSTLRYMRMAMECMKPDAVIHLGDYVSDGMAVASDYPDVRFYQVAGNCDRFRAPADVPETSLEMIGGIRVYFTHGHNQRVKQNLHTLLLEAHKCNAQLVLYGHTHVADCRLLEDGMWVMNPGSCGYGDGFVGLVEVDSSRNITCTLINHRDLEAAL